MDCKMTPEEFAKEYGIKNTFIVSYGENIQPTFAPFAKRFVGVKRSKVVGAWRIDTIHRFGKERRACMRLLWAFGCKTNEYGVLQRGRIFVLSKE